MARQYAENRIRQALKLHNNNILKVRQQIIAWTYEDPKLLHELAKPHLSGIIGYAVSHVQRKDAEAAAEANKRAEAQKKEKKPAGTEGGSEEDLSWLGDLPDEEKDDGFGIALLKAIATGEPAMFGHETETSRPLKKTAASKRHANTMRLIADKVEKNKKPGDN